MIPLPHWWHWDCEALEEQRRKWIENLLARRAHRGVDRIREKYRAQVKWNGNVYYLGVFPSEQAAINACRAKRRELAQRLLESLPSPTLGS